MFIQFLYFKNITPETFASTTANAQNDGGTAIGELMYRAI